MSKLVGAGRHVSPPPKLVCVCVGGDSPLPPISGAYGTVAYAPPEKMMQIGAFSVQFIYIYVCYIFFLCFFS